MPFASTPTRLRAPALGDRGDADQADQLLGREPCHRGRARERVPGCDPHLGPSGALALDDTAGDVLGELLDERCLLEYDRLDRLLEELGETRHVHALLTRVEVDGAVDGRGHQLLAALVADPDRLLDSADAGAGQREPHLRLGRLEIDVAPLSLGRCRISDTRLATVAPSS